LRRGRRRSNTFATAFAKQSANRLGRVEVELIFTLTKVVIALYLHEQRFEASMREASELVTAVRRNAPRGASILTKMKQTKMEAGKNIAPISSQFIRIRN
jgi:short subunit fatty acids transporter